MGGVVSIFILFLAQKEDAETVITLPPEQILIGDVGQQDPQEEIIDGLVQIDQIPEDFWGRSEFEHPDALIASELECAKTSLFFPREIDCSEMPCVIIYGSKTRMALGKLQLREWVGGDFCFTTEDEFMEANHPTSQQLTFVYPTFDWAFDPDKGHAFYPIFNSMDLCMAYVPVTYQGNGLIHESTYRLTRAGYWRLNRNVIERCNRLGLKHIGMTIDEQSLPEWLQLKLDH